MSLDSSLLRAPVLAAALLASGGGDARAYDVQVEAQVIGQGYQLRAADASLVDRRRLTTYLSLSVWNLGPRDRDGLPLLRNQWNATFSMRFDTDLGNYLCNVGRESVAAPLSCMSRDRGASDTSPELMNNRPEILFGFVEGKNLAGFVDLRIGRQLQWELFDLRGLDGVWAEVHTPFYLAAQLFGGLNVTGALPIDSPIYTLDGTSHTPQNQAMQPTVGFALRSYGFRDVQAQLSYRRSFSRTEDPAAPGCPIGPDGRPTACAPDGFGVIEERMAYNLRGRLLDGRLLGWGGLRYDFLNGRFDEGNAGVRGYLTPLHSLALEYVFNAPTWDGDSIFNVFSSMPYNDLRLMYDGRLGRLRTHGRAFSRLFETEGVSSSGKAYAVAWGGTAGVRWDQKLGFLRADGYVDGGYGGMRAGADLSARLLFFRNVLGVEGRLTYMYFSDEQRAENSTHSLGMQAGARYVVARGILLHVLVENNINRFYNSQLRVVALLDLSYFLASPQSGAAPPGLLASGMGNFPPLAGRGL